MRFALAVLCTCVLVALGAFVVPAQAGGYRYYDNGYYPRYGGNVWYSSSCCYEKIVRHEVRYVRIDPYGGYGYYDPYRRYGYYGPYGREGYYGPYRDDGYGLPVSYYTDAYVGPPRRYYGYRAVYGPRYQGYYNGYDAYNSADVACVQRRAQALDGKRVCY